MLTRQMTDRAFHRLRLVGLLLGPALVAGVGCGDDGGGTAGRPCTQTFVEGFDDEMAIRSAVASIGPNATLCFDGEFSITRELRFESPTGLTLRGVGGRATFDFSGQTDGANGVLVENAAGFTAERLRIVDSDGDGLKISESDGIHIRDVHVEWTTPMDPMNGAYGIYPVRSQNVLVEDCEISGASGAGLYLGQSNEAILRNNVLHDNVAGIEIENTADTEAYGNESYDNTVGFVVFDLLRESFLGPPEGGRGPNGSQGQNVLIRDNVIRNNNTPSFASGGFVSVIPAGTGLVVYNMDRVEFRDNVVRNHSGPGTLVLSQVFLSDPAVDLDDPPPDGYDPYPRALYFHGNQYWGNGGNPSSGYAIVQDALGESTLPDILWDGIARDEGERNCFDEPGGVSFRALGEDPLTDDPEMSTIERDIESHRCEGYGVPAVAVPVD